MSETSVESEEIDTAETEAIDAFDNLQQLDVEAAERALLAVKDALAAYRENIRLQQGRELKFGDIAHLISVTSYWMRSDDNTPVGKYHSKNEGFQTIVKFDIPNATAYPEARVRGRELFIKSESWTIARVGNYGEAVERWTTMHADYGCTSDLFCWSFEQPDRVQHRYQDGGMRDLLLLVLYDMLEYRNFRPFEADDLTFATESTVGENGARTWWQDSPLDTFIKAVLPPKLLDVELDLWRDDGHKITVRELIMTKVEQEHIDLESTIEYTLPRYFEED